MILNTIFNMIKILVKIMMVMLLFSISFAQVNTNNNVKEDKIKELSDKVEILSEELQKQKAGNELFIPLTNKGAYGLGPAASKVYQKKHNGVSIGGYGEFSWNTFHRNDESGKRVSSEKVPNRIDTLRAVLYFGYKFNDKFIVNTEIEYEHANQIGVEFAYLDYLHREYLNFRAGLLLSPLGFMNELHEPTTFNSVSRSTTERLIIPTTWREIGAGIFGSKDFISYKLYLMSSFDGVKFSSAGVRSGRQNGANALAHNISGVGRLDFNFDNVTVGASSFLGGSGQVKDALGLTSISDVHFEARVKGFYNRTLISFAYIQDVDQLNAYNKYTGTKSIGQELLGAYTEIGYNVLNEVNTNQNLTLFSRYEFVDTQFKVPSGFQRDGSNQQHVITNGIAYKPILNIVLKADYQIIMTKAKTGVNQLNVGLGYIF